MPVITVFGDEYLDEIRTPVALVLMLIVCLSEAKTVHQFVILQVEVEGIGGESSLSTWLPECVVVPVSKVFHVGVIPFILWITSKLESFEVKIRVLRLGRLPHLLDIGSLKASEALYQSLLFLYVLIFLFAPVVTYQTTKKISIEKNKQI